MKTISSLAVSAFSALLLAGCASGFKPVKRESLSYKASSLSPEIEFSYSRDALRASGNRRYDRRAVTTRTDIVAVRIQNKTDHPLSVKDSLAFYSGSKEVEPANASEAIRRIRQSPGMYALFLMMAPVNIYGSSTSCDNYDCHSSFTFIPVGLIIGPLLTGINAAVASSANDGFRKEVAGHDLSDTTLAPGEIATGYLVFPHSGTRALTAKLKSSTAVPAPSAPDPFEDQEDAPPARARDFR